MRVNNKVPIKKVINKRWTKINIWINKELWSNIISNNSNSNKTKISWISIIDAIAKVGKVGEGKNIIIQESWSNNQLVIILNLIDNWIPFRHSINNRWE